MIAQRDLEVLLDIQIHDMVLFQKALTHKSMHASFNYERLELIGDRVIDMYAVLYLNSLFPHCTVHQLATYKINLTKKDTLSQFCRDLKLEDHVLFQSTDIKPVYKHDLCEDVFEAICGALFLDNRDTEVVYQFLSRLFKTIPINKITENQNYKGTLNEMCHNALYFPRLAKNPYDTPKVDYQLTTPAEFVDETMTEKKWTVSLLLDGKPYGTGVGRTRKNAEQMAAHQTIKMLKSSVGQN